MTWPREDPSTADVCLESLTEACTGTMYRWMRDPEVADHLGLRREPSPGATLAWIRRAETAEDTVGFAIVLAGRHVGNVVLDRIDRRSMTARLSVYVGEADARRQGVARKAILRALDVAFFDLDMKEVWLSVHAEHATAIRLYTGLGFDVVEIHWGEFSFRGRQLANLYMALSRSRHRRRTRAGKVACVVLQPSYIPWRGYFHQIMKADVFVFYDDVQYNVRGWRNRNRICGPNGSFWLTIPIKNRQLRRRRTTIDQVEIDWSQPWHRKHLKSLLTSYRRAPYYEDYTSLLDTFYKRRDRQLADFVIDFDVAIAHELGIRGTDFVRSSTLRARGSRSERLLETVREVGANHYITGPRARSYLDECLFQEAGIGLEYMRYEYPEYQQLFGDFDPYVSILDLLFLKGREASQFIEPRPEEATPETRRGLPSHRASLTGGPNRTYDGAACRGAPALEGRRLWPGGTLHHPTG